MPERESDESVQIEFTREQAVAAEMAFKRNWANLVEDDPEYAEFWSDMKRTVADARR